MDAPSDGVPGRGATLLELVRVVERAGGSGRLVDPTGAAAQLRPGTITHDSRRLRPGAIFACLRGEFFDGHDFAGAAVDAGAAALVVDHEVDVDPAAPQLVVDDTRRSLGPISAAVFGDPSEQLVSVGITGTNGKTTTAHLLAAVLEANGWPCGVVGTLHGPRTTPEAPDLQATLAEFVREGRRAVVLEVSSHALALRRVDGTRFDAVVFTNLGRDHLDLHGSQEEYFRAKAALFTPRFSGLGVINTDDPHGRLLADAAADGDAFTVVPFGLDQVADVVVGAERHSYRWRGTEVTVPIGGAFNVVNSLAALTVATQLGVPPAVAADGLAAVEAVPGRFELVRPAGGAAPFQVVVDYAHTPDGLGGLLASAREVAGPSGSVIAVFGCGGDRDREKRAAMGEIAARSADRVIVTSDNPRHEDPDAIIAEIVAGVPADGVATVTANPDRRAAIGEAIAGAGAGDVVVIAGKGHESTQDLGHTIIDFDDRAIARALLEELP